MDKLNGWKTACGYDVYLEDGYITRAMKNDGHGMVAAWVYRKSKHGGWDIVDRITPAAFRAGFRRGTIRIF